MTAARALAIAAFLISCGLVGLQQLFTGERFDDYWRALSLLTLPIGIPLGMYGLYRFRADRSVNIDPDMGLHQYVGYRLGIDWQDWNDTSNDRSKEIINGTASVLRELGGKARLSRITVWGRKDDATGVIVPLSPIPPEDWDQFQIDFLELLDGRDNRTVRAVSPYARTAHVFYTDIHLNRKQVEQTWPKPRRKARFQSPIVFEKPKSL